MNRSVDKGLCSTSYKHVQYFSKICWQKQFNLMIRLQNLLKMSSRRICKTSWRRFEDVLKMPWRGLENVLKTSWRHLWRRMDKTNILVLTKTSWRRMINKNIFVLKTSWRRLLKAKPKDVFKASSRRLHQNECLLGIAFVQTNCLYINRITRKVEEDKKSLTNNFLLKKWQPMQTLGASTLQGLILQKF